MTPDEVVQALESQGIKRVRRHEPMARHTSWRIGGPADYLCLVEDEVELQKVIEAARHFGMKNLVLGGGNNILVSDEGIEGLVILNRMRGIRIESEGDPQVVCGAGTFFAKIAQYTARNGYTGMEWGVAIPGTAGGGVVNNAGAHGCDVHQTLAWAGVLSSRGYRRVPVADLAYGYRQSLLKTLHTAQSSEIVIDCAFRVKATQAQDAELRVEEYRQHRIRTQPVKEASAGSTFKNPPGDHAGALIDRAGLKGLRVGGAQLATLHGNFLLNHDHAKAADVVEIMLRVREDVRERFGITLEPEVQLVGRWNAETISALTSVDA